MAADFDKPTATSTYLNFATEIRANMDAVAIMDYSGASNITTNSIRLNGSSTGFDKYNGAAWVALVIGTGLDDTPVNGQTAEGITSNWAYDHAALTTAHGATGANVGTTNTQTLTNKTFTSPVFNTGISGSAFLDQDNMADDSATKICSQQSIKAYTDNSLAMIDVDGDSTAKFQADDDYRINIAGADLLTFGTGGLGGTRFLDQDNMSGNSAVSVASQQSIKAYGDGLITTHLSSYGHVTNGNSHNHIGGCGAQIAHTSLFSIGTNTHATIDTHLANVTKHRLINDAGATTTVLWSASKITAAIAAGGLAAASQAQMEAATSNAVAATPLNTNWHPGVSKATLKCGPTGNILSSHNIASISDISVGRMAIVWDTDFSGYNYSVNVTLKSTVGLIGVVDGVVADHAVQMYFKSYASPATATDPLFWYVTAFGDQ